jgi:hypothetical protein
LDEYFMKVLRLVLLGLAAIIFMALGWRLVREASHPHPELASTAPPAQAPAPQNPVPQVPPAQVPAPASAPASPSAAGGPSAPPGPAAAIPQTAPPSAPEPVSDAAKARVESALRDAPELAKVFDELRTDFPAVADRAIAGAAARLRTDGDKPSADDVFGSAMRELRQSFGVLAAKAGPEALGAIFERQAAALDELAKTDPQICADYLYGGTSVEYGDFAKAHRGLVAQAAQANLDAILDGRKQQITRGVPSAGDFKLVEDGLAAKGLSVDEISALLDGKSLDPPLPDARLCSNARTYLEVLRDLPADPRLRIYGLSAELLARS